MFTDSNVIQPCPYRLLTIPEHDHFPPRLNFENSIRHHTEEYNHVLEVFPLWRTYKWNSQGSCLCGHTALCFSLWYHMAFCLATGKESGLFIQFRTKLSYLLQVNRTLELTQIICFIEQQISFSRTKRAIIFVFLPIYKLPNKNIFVRNKYSRKPINLG